MVLLNVDKMFEEAVNKQSINDVENLLQCSDSKCELMKNYSQTNKVENLLCLLCEFKSRGLVMNIENLCIQHNNFENFYVKDNTFKQEKIVFEHKANKKINATKHLRGSSFKNRIKQELVDLNVVNPTNYTKVTA